MLSQFARESMIVRGIRGVSEFYNVDFCRGVLFYLGAEMIMEVGAPRTHGRGRPTYSLTSSPPHTYLPPFWSRDGEEDQEERSGAEAQDEGDGEGGAAGSSEKRIKLEHEKRKRRAVSAGVGGTKGGGAAGEGFQSALINLISFVTHGPN